MENKKDMSIYVNNLVSNLISDKCEDTIEEHYIKSWQTLGVMCVDIVNTPITLDSVCNRAEARNNLLTDIFNTEEKLTSKFMEEMKNG